MKAIFTGLLAAGVLLTLTGCGNEEDRAGSIDSISAESTANSSSDEQKESIYVGKIESITEAEGGVYQIFIVDVEEKEDPDNIVSSFSNDGVILNASTEQIAGGIDSLKVGEQVEFKLVEMAIMTMSIPPQVPGNSIIEITAQ
ncbi:hypothetical protein A5844_000778 [Enterococcus sp. 10A9_DIV0425]|uniref:Lipoprotein n=1 Tax=Candidatus Enterococcus wittei TaxID=1987383 RepID=A0A2C9XQS2_9ENTE|nr:hypothetical protein [Enterococcus sp. 10A9_DIV0425]OTP12545.1 hypothetical protein A5844_000778 [Enterococcus sp. 10A9_DIV0425]THE15543.1 hypothetical protein E1H99_03200 [Enterococcus hirae]